MDANQKCCSCQSGCCDITPKSQKIKIDFLYLDLSQCKRCQDTESNLDEAIGEVSSILSVAGFDVEVNKLNISSKELAEKYKFLSSPTIRINGVDITQDIEESSCVECGDICGEDVDCRVWTYKGVKYNEPPKPLIINAILKEVYSENRKDEINNSEYKLPHNLETFFNGKSI